MPGWIPLLTWIAILLCVFLSLLGSAITLLIAWWLKKNKPEYMPYARQLQKMGWVSAGIWLGLWLLSYFFLWVISPQAG